MGILTTAIAVFSASIGDWLWFGGAVAVVAVCAVLTWRSYR